jgi:hypothetical protein
MKCSSGKCVCGKACQIDHELVNKRCACDGQHHRPHVGERWKFDDGTCSYVAEIITIGPKLKCKIVDMDKDVKKKKKIQPISWGTYDKYGNWKYPVPKKTAPKLTLGKILFPVTLTKDGPIVDPETPRGRKLFWSYLTGQETPTV